MSPAKRAVDVVVALTALLLLTPVLLAIAAAVRLADGGPALYRQRRVGRGGRVFGMLKFRTMIVDADRAGGALTVAGDRRVTSIGRTLRRLKLDELPQLLHVLRGEMSLVGPRPEVPRYVARYTRAQRAVLDLTPGLTDPASLAFLDEEALLAARRDPEASYVDEILPEKIRLNLEYAARATVGRDVALVARTAGAVLARGWAMLPHPQGARALLRLRRSLIVGAYLVLIPVGYAAAFAIRFDFDVPVDAATVLVRTLPLLAVLRLATFWRAGLFRGYWQHFGLHDLLIVAKAATVSSAVFAAALWGLGLLGAVPRSVLLLDWGLAIFAVGGVHFLARCVREGHAPWRRSAAGRRTLIVGAGEAAERLLRQFHHDQRVGVRVVGLVDDAPAKRGRVLHGVTVLGTTAELAALAERHAATLLVIAMPSAAPEAKRRVVQACLATGLEFRVVRPLQEVVDGRAALGPMRTVEVEDLLGRPPVQLDLGATAALVTGRVVLITGGAGSIGSELARQVARLGPAKVVLYEQAETPLYFTHLELRQQFPELVFVPITGSITDAEALRRAFADHRPHLVFHAAAYKHVPMMEDNVLAAVQTNVLGTLQVARCAVAFGAERVLLLSTDKAVYPSSVMGATKRIAERLVLGWPELAGSPTEFRAVRFGNVLGSDGSVIPLFRRQLAVGGPLTVTHPDVCRYFMTVQEAVQLVLQSIALPEAAGRIAMLEMGAPVRIVELAENLIRLSGHEPYGDVGIVFTGLRPGEKMAEDLVSALEAGVPTGVDKIRLSQPDASPDALRPETLAALACAVQTGDANAALRLIRELVPECVAPLRHRPAALPTGVVCAPLAPPWSGPGALAAPGTGAGRRSLAPVDAWRGRVEGSHSSALSVGGPGVPELSSPS